MKLSKVEFASPAPFPASGTKFAILYRFHSNPELQRSRLRIIRHFNPQVEIYALYSGTEPHLAKVELFNSFDHFYHFDHEDKHFKCLHSDLMIKTWFTDVGHMFDFDVLVDHQWDMVLAKPVHELYSYMTTEKVALSHLRPMKEIVDTWRWTSGAYKPAYKAYTQYMSYKYGMGMQTYACLGPGAAFGRSFLESFGEEEYPLEIFGDLNMEVVMPGMPEALGFEVVDAGFHSRSSEGLRGVANGRLSGDWAMWTSPHFHVSEQHLVGYQLMEQCMNRRKGQRYFAFHPVKQAITLEKLLNCRNNGPWLKEDDNEAMKMVVERIKVARLGPEHALNGNKVDIKAANRKEEIELEWQTL